MIEKYMRRRAYDLGVNVDSLLPDYFEVIGGTGFGEITELW